LRLPQSSSRIHNPAKEDPPLDYVFEKPKIRQVKYDLTNGVQEQVRENPETQRLKIIMDIKSVVDRHRFDADSDLDPD
jgi:hypothetical protein